MVTKVRILVEDGQELSANGSAAVLTITFLIKTLFTRYVLKEIKTSNDFFTHYKLLTSTFQFPLKEVATFTYRLFLMSLTLFPFLTEIEPGWAVNSGRLWTGSNI